jgi:hypothetical protein
MPEEHLDEHSPRVTGAGSIFSRPDPVSLGNIRAFVDALRANTRGRDESAAFHRPACSGRSWI